jgi:hypothetical protein
MTEIENPLLQQEVVSENSLKEMFIQYVGEKFEPEDGRVTVEMAVEAMAEEFPEFLMLLAEENFIRGYQQACIDMESASKEEIAEQENV